ncbi:hypothetical protein ERJ75_000620700 [Trypanosoma vivax]|nr:hypothetical protein ERJ75_000620700 [Trypanosoma vivax]
MAGLPVSLRFATPAVQGARDFDSEHVFWHRGPRTLVETQRVLVSVFPLFASCMRVFFVLLPSDCVNVFSAGEVLFGKHGPVLPEVRGRSFFIASFARRAARHLRVAAVSASSNDFVALCCVCSFALREVKGLLWCGAASRCVFSDCILPGLSLARARGVFAPGPGFEPPEPARRVGRAVFSRGGWSTRCGDFGVRSEALLGTDGVEAFYLHCTSCVGARRECALAAATEGRAWPGRPCRACGPADLRADRRRCLALSACAVVRGEFWRRCVPRSDCAAGVGDPSPHRARRSPAVTAEVEEDLRFLPSAQARGTGQQALGSRRGARAVALHGLSLGNGMPGSGDARAVLRARRLSGAGAVAIQHCSSPRTRASARCCEKVSDRCGENCPWGRPTWRARRWAATIRSP